MYHLKHTIFHNQLYNKKKNDGYVLQDYHWVNHFPSLGHLNTKPGLTKAFKKPNDYSSPDMMLPDEVYPKAFVLTQDAFPKSINPESSEDVYGLMEFKAFTQEFRIVAAESLLKKFDGELTLQDFVCLQIAMKRLVLE